ncbi:MAG: LptA/OstA family protein [Spirochaetota bacterium]
MRTGRLIVYLLVMVVWVCTNAVYADNENQQQKIHYGGDTYTIDYRNEIIYARGNAFFEKGKYTLAADRIQIYYAETEKRLEAYGNVVLKEQGEAVRVSGDHGTAFYGDDIYIIEGSAVYREKDTTIQAQQIKSSGEQKYWFDGGVRYTDPGYEIYSQSLNVSEQVAGFEGVEKALFTASGDVVYCQSIEYFLNSGNITFRGHTLYIQKPDSEQHNPLISQSGALKYLKQSQSFILMDRVYIVNGQLELSAPLVRYYRDSEVMEATGSVTAYDGSKYIYCQKIRIDAGAGQMSFYNSVNGVISSSGEGVR